MNIKWYTTVVLAPFSFLRIFFENVQFYKIEWVRNKLFSVNGKRNKGDHNDRLYGIVYKSFFPYGLIKMLFLSILRYSY